MCFIGGQSVGQCKAAYLREMGFTGLLRKEEELVTRLTVASSDMTQNVSYRVKYMDTPRVSLDSEFFI